MKLLKSISPLSLSLLLALLLITPRPLWAAMDMYMTIDGIPGESQTYKGAIDLLSVSQELAVIIDAKSNLPGQITLSNIWFTKYIDTASPGLLSYLAASGAGKSATIKVNRAGTKNPYWQVELREINLTSIQQESNSANDRGTEKVSFSFGRVLVTYTTTTGETVSGGYDPATCFPTTEVCDGVDNDCDGAIDEALAGDGTVTNCGQGECAFSGMLSCENGAWVNTCIPGTPSQEICDGRDNDCDGQTDEDFPDLGSPCTAGLGICQRSGIMVCDAISQGQICNAIPGASSIELCDGLDNDCNGLVDDNCLYQIDADGDLDYDGLDLAALDKAFVAGKAKQDDIGRFAKAFGTSQ